MSKLFDITAFTPYKNKGGLLVIKILSFPKEIVL